MALTRQTPLTQLPGVGPARGKRLEKLGLDTMGDLLNHLPVRYEDRRECFDLRDAPEGRPCCVSAMVAAPPQISRVRKGLELVKVKAVDHVGTLHLTFFNQAYLKDALRPGETYVFYGIVGRQGRIRTMTNPVFEREGSGRHTGLIMPVYPLTAGISNNLLAGLTRRAVDECLDGLKEFLPAQIRLEHALCQTEYARKHIHYPASYEELAVARRRLVFEELFVLTCGLSLLKERRSRGRGAVLRGMPEEFAKLLPFVLTDAQRRTMEELAVDLAGGRAMNRLIQGDVGSGKTVVAAFGAWAAAKNGCQCALMAPTELLAEQHAHTMNSMLSPAGIRVGLLTGSVKGVARKALLSALAAGELDVVVGTHALFSQDVVYHNLALVIADEQHRFGVAQRASLAAKGGGMWRQPSRGSCEGSETGPSIPDKVDNDGVFSPHVLVMSATPIPRTLALIIYGDLDVSILDQMPPGRTPVSTYVVGEDKRGRMYAFIHRQVEEGRQVYIVCPTVEETDPAAEDSAKAPDLKAVTSYAEQLRDRVFPDLRVGLVHGRMKPKEKEPVMTAFRSGELDVLVSTTVIEVGVDVPNASVMVVENAERFGLSQLHQLRGRVGRGTHRSYCVLVTSSRSESAKERLRVLCATNDGFQIAEEDLRLRGPGDFFGKRQHGLPQLKVADFAADVALLKEAQQTAVELISADPELENPAHVRLKDRVRELFKEHADLFN